MKKLILKAAIVFVSHLNFAWAQQDVVNGDFEFWDTIPGTNGLEDPFGWTSNNFVIYNCTTGVYNPSISKSTDSYSGNYSLRISHTNSPNGARISMVEGNCQYNFCWNFICDNYPVTYIHQKIVGYYKFHPDSSVYDTANINLVQIGFDSIAGITTAAREGGIWFAPAQNWTYFEVPIGYNTIFPFQGEVLLINLNSFTTSTSTNPQGFLLIDSLAIVPETVTDIHDLANQKIKLTPNPVQEKLVVESSDSFKSFELCDLSGRIIKSGLYEKEIDVGILSKGIYFLRLQSEKQIVVGKFIKE